MDWRERGRLQRKAESQLAAFFLSLVVFLWVVGLGTGFWIGVGGCGPEEEKQAQQQADHRTGIDDWYIDDYDCMSR